MANGYGNLTPQGGSGRLGTLGTSDIPGYDFLPSWDLSSYLEGIGLWGQEALSPNLQGYNAALTGQPGLMDTPITSEYGLGDIYGGGLGPTSPLFQGELDLTQPDYFAQETLMDPVDYGPAFRKLYGEAGSQGQLGYFMG